MKKKSKKNNQSVEGNKEIKEMVEALNELPADVLRQLLKNLEDIEEYNKNHPEEEEEEDKK